MTEPLYCPTTVPLPVVIGVSGHRDIDPKSLDQVRTRVAEVLAHFKCRFGDSLYIMTGLADGADQLVHREAKLQHIRRIAVLPLPHDRYVQEIKNRPCFEECWQDADLRIELPPLESAGSDGDERYLRRYYEQLGAFLISRSHLLLILWEGPERETAVKRHRSQGGTADVLHMRFDVHRAIEAYGDSPLFAGCDSRLDVAHADPVVQIVTPRTDTAEVQYRTHAGACHILHDQSGHNKSEIANTNTLLTSLSEKAQGAFAQICGLNECIKKFAPDYKKQFAQHVEYLKTPSLRDDRNEHLLLLKCLQAETDVAAAIYQRRLIGQLSGVRLTEMWGRFQQAREKGTPRPWPGALTLFSAIVPISVAALEFWFQLHISLAFLAVYLLLTVGTFAFFKCVMQKNKWQDRFQDYRALAEALRVQLYWAVAAMPIAASDNYLRKQAGELGWIQFALRGPAIWAAALARDLKIPRREDVLKGWITNQIEFFSGTEKKPGKAAQNNDAANRNKAAALRCFTLGMAVIAAIFCVDAAHDLFAGRSGCLWIVPHFIYGIRDELEVFAVVLSAVAASLAVSTDLRAYKAHAHNYAQMGAIFDRARTSERLIPEGDIVKYQKLMRDLGREALSENAEWLMDHRDREVEPSP